MDPLSIAASTVPLLEAAGFWTVILGCFIYMLGVVIQMITGHGDALATIVAGRLVAGLGVGFESAIVILYMSEICPRKVRGALVAGYQFCITIGIMLASIVVYATKERNDTGAYRIPIAIHWANCFRGSVFKSNSNLRKTILGTSLQMMQQWTGVNFIFYYSTPFLRSTGAVKDEFLMSLVFTLVNVLSTPLSFWTVERFGRRFILIVGAFGMLVSQYLVAIIGVTIGFNHTHPDPNDADKSIADNIPAVNSQIAFIAISIFFFASTWGPGAWILIGEIFPLPIRSRGVALSTASNWLWNTVIAVITPYMVGEDYGNMKSSVFFVWGSLCTAAFVYSYFFVPETKGLSLEQVDRMMEETTPRTSSKWTPHETFAGARSHGGVLDKSEAV
ncbi:hypothetical protein BN1723_012023 [Verticillium longisporum]|uniref:Major facilitator superfamily (MFS) profile domain-containing protein n=1 Tax=Verticillium longisporum TaxID=100787 RepID=A0A0G4LDN0_VERLO|nr:hypothetical protein BN1723_012023 [Verticillium longisporum]